MDHNARTTEGGRRADEEAITSALDFLAALLTATVVKREGKQDTLQWRKHLPPGRVEYEAIIRGGEQALYVTVGTDQELACPVVRVQLRGAAHGIRPNWRNKVLDVFDLDVTSDAQTRETFNILRQSIASQVAANERAGRAKARPTPIVEMRVEISPEVGSVLDRYFASDDEEETEE